MAETPGSTMVDDLTVLLANLGHAGSDQSRQNKLDAAENSLILAQCHVRTLENAEQQINRLAPEVLSQIFVLFDALQFVEKIEDALDAAALKRKSLLDICRVCGQWRRVALSTPHLWNHILIRRPSDPFSLRSLSLSGTLPLVLYFFGHPKESIEVSGRDTFEVAMEHSDRLKELYIYGAWNEDCRYWKSLQCEVPKLKVLKMFGSSRTFFQSPRLPKLFLDSCPSLERVYLSIFSPLPNAQFRGLRSLFLHSQDVRDLMGLGFCRYLFLLELSPQLEELIITRSGPAHETPSNPLPNFSDNPVVLPRLRTLSLGCWLDSTEDILAFLSYIRIPDSAARYVFAIPRSEWEVPLVDLIQKGRLDGHTPTRAIRKLRMIASSLLEGRSAFGLENDTLTFTSNIDPMIRAGLLNSGLLSDVEEFIFVSSTHYPPSLEDFRLIFQSLPSLRHFTMSGLPQVILPRITKALRLDPDILVPVSDVPPCPLLTSIDVLCFPPGGAFDAITAPAKDSSKSEKDEKVVDGVLVALLAEDRAKRGYPLRRVVVERCRQEHLGWIEEYVKDVLSLKRWEGWPLGYYERSILREAYEMTKGIGIISAD